MVCMYYSMPDIVMMTVALFHSSLALGGGVGAPLGATVWARLLEQDRITPIVSTLQTAFFSSDPHRSFYVCRALFGGAILRSSTFACHLGLVFA
mmetsp:Transcript_78/g.311  ORF Transcript_78/g.311 Transcript_78/m.311 type:complete len:94 (+) Transcript_78:152-433(+)